MAEVVKLGFVGTGGIARHHLEQLAKLEGVQIGAVCDVVEERARESAAAFGGTVYTDYVRMLEDTKLDGLYVCVPPAMHRSREDGAKPVCLDLEEGIKVRDAIARAGVMSSVGYGSRYSAAAEATRRFCAGRTVGMVACDRWGGVPGNASHWWRRMEISGGQLHEMATHQLDLIRWFAGEITEVYKREARQINRELENFTVPDSEIVSFQLAGGGIGTEDEVAIGHDRSADPGRHGHIQEVIDTAGGAEGLLAQCGDVRVALEVDRQPEGRLEAGGNRDVVEVAAQVRRADDHAGPGIDRSGR